MTTLVYLVLFSVQLYSFSLVASGLGMKERAVPEVAELDLQGGSEFRQ